MGVDQVTTHRQVAQPLGFKGPRSIAAAAQTPHLCDPVTCKAPVTHETITLSATASFRRAGA